MAKTRKNQSSKLPVPSPGKNLKKADKIKLAKSICTMYAEGGNSLTNCLLFHGISSRATWYRWTREIKQIKQLYDDSCEIRTTSFQGEIVEALRRSIISNITGWKEELNELGGEITEWDEDDNPVHYRPTLFRKKEVYNRPNSYLIKTLSEKYALELGLEFDEDEPIIQEERELKDWTDEEVQAELARLEAFDEDDDG